MENIVFTINEKMVLEEKGKMEDYIQYVFMKTIIQRNLLNDMILNKDSKHYIKSEKNQKILFFLLKQMTALNIRRREMEYFNKYINS